MTVPRLTPEQLAAGLKQVGEGGEIDWKGATILAVQVAETIRSATSPRRTVTFRNARIDGDLQLDGIGDAGEPLRLQFLSSVINGDFRARSARWRHLVLAECQLRSIDLPGSQFEGDLIVELTRCTGWLELRSSMIGRGLALNGSYFARGDRDAAVNFSDTMIGGNLSARDLRALGSVKGRGVRVGSDISFDGAQIDGRGDGEPLALDLSRASAVGRVRLCQGDSGRFIARGRIQLNNAVVGQLDCKAALFDGAGQPALVGDQLEVRGHADLSGLSERGGSSFEAIGEVRLSAATISQQLQIHDARFSGEDNAISMVGTRLGADVLIGHPATNTQLFGTLYADDLRVAGRLIVHGLEAQASDTAISLRQCRIDGEVVLYEVTANAPIRFDNSHANGIAIESARITRARPATNRQGFPEHYAHPEHCLLDLSFVRLLSDLRLEAVHLQGGDLRIIGARIEGGLQMSRASICDVSGLALIAQGAEFGTGVQIAGSPDEASLMKGEIQFLGATVRGDITLAHVTVGTPEVPAALTLHAAQVASGLTLVHCTVHGAIRASAAKLGGNFFVHSSLLLNPENTVCDLRGIVIGGKLQFASAVRAELIAVRIDGQVVADNGEAATLGWESVALADKSLLAFTNMRIARQIEAGVLIAEGAGGLNLSGTSVPLLADRIDDEEDSWGAGKLSLGLDNFAYDRLERPSGRSGDAPHEIRRWRSKWLARRHDPGSARPARHLATVLRNQGLFEAARRVLVDAFAAEGQMRPTWMGRMLSEQFGLWFGHGLSGARAFVTLMLVWVLGVQNVMSMYECDLMVADESGKPAVSCGNRIDPTIYAADAMLPVLDLGEEKKCRVGQGPRAKPEPGWKIGGWEVSGEVALARFWWALYCVLGWTVVSFAIATWSGLFRRGGRE
ncbi:hypothetical protein HNO88_004020 [Novosphingobium chloroacetimidivorans]|uniref:Membrane-associated oxidoreductase n=1 Tax=Novosphingobium chloroacetimidivorans TaxID=1428314 RepID=A0A7W7NXS8_9SPHN|nr:hypothetical protein [Novosphingobium chloroacetimidivorans]MBB4860676.1 hypothetical protein [Novosphingobium chloroacetimidivorans]